MSEGSGEIIVKGGSVQLYFDGTIYQKVPSDPNAHKNQSRAITRVQVKDENGQSLYDSGANDGGMKWTITVSTK